MEEYQVMASIPVIREHDGLVTRNGHLVQRESKISKPMNRDELNKSLDKYKRNLTYVDKKIGSLSTFVSTGKTHNSKNSIMNPVPRTNVVTKEMEPSVIPRAVSLNSRT